MSVPLVEGELTLRNNCIANDLPYLINRRYGDTFALSKLKKALKTNDTDVAHLRAQHNSAKRQVVSGKGKLGTQAGS